MVSFPGSILYRKTEPSRRVVIIEIDGVKVEAFEGDTVLTAVLTRGIRLRTSEFGDGPRAGFCLMGACQDCWMWTADNDRLRACTTYVVEGLRLTTVNPEWTP